jgi:DNA-binding PadR family transcriptional regulator
MSEKHVVLGALVRNGPASIAELDEHVRERTGFLGVDQAFVERAVVELCAKGLIEGTGEMRAGDARPRERVIYAATSLGSAELDRWIREPPQAIDLEALTAPMSGLLPEEAPSPEELDALIAEAARREQRARRDLGENKVLPSEQIDAGNRPWPEVARDIVHNGEVIRLECEIDALVELQQFLKGFRDEMRAGG